MQKEPLEHLDPWPDSAGCDVRQNRREVLALQVKLIVTVQHGGKPEGLEGEKDVSQGQGGRREGGHS